MDTKNAGPAGVGRRSMDDSKLKGFQNVLGMVERMAEGTGQNVSHHMPLLLGTLAVRVLWEALR
jgi:hypothetical protein